MKEILKSIKKYYCKHSFGNTTKVLQVIVKDREIYNHNDLFIYSVNIRVCNFCGKYFIDEGYEPESSKYKHNVSIPMDAPVSDDFGGQTIKIFKDKINNIYVKTNREIGFMTRITDGTMHDGTTMGEFEFIKEVRS